MNVLTLILTTYAEVPDVSFLLVPGRQLNDRGLQDLV